MALFEQKAFSIVAPVEADVEAVINALDDSWTVKIIPIEKQLCIIAFG